MSGTINRNVEFGVPIYNIDLKDFDAETLKGILKKVSISELIGDPAVQVQDITYQKRSGTCIL